jgi:hypothetical protein
MKKYLMEFDKLVNIFAILRSRNRYMWDGIRNKVMKKIYCETFVFVSERSKKQLKMVI